MSKNKIRFLMACAFLWATPTLTSYIDTDKQAIVTCLKTCHPRPGSWNYEQIKETLDYALADNTDPIAALIKRIDTASTDVDVCAAAQDVMMHVMEEYPYAFATFARHKLSTMGHNDESINTFFDCWQAEHQNPQAVTQTYAHLLTQKVSKPFKFFEQQTFQPQLIHAVLKERALCQNNYQVFYHGQKSFFGFYQDLCTALLKECFNQGIVKYQLPDDYLFIRTPKNLKALMNQTLSKNQLKVEQMERAAIMGGTPDYNRCLSANGCLFGNSDCYGSCTWRFVTSNTNSILNNIPDVAFQIFNGLDYRYAYETFSERIKQLEYEHGKFFTVGRLLQIAIPKNLVDECVFVTFDGATQTHVWVESVFWLYYPTSKATTIIESGKRKKTAAYQHSNYWEHHFGIVMTEDIALNPFSGIKVFAYDPQPHNSVELEYQQITYQEHKAKIEQLVNDIVIEMKKNR